MVKTNKQINSPTRRIAKGRIYITATFNNTLITVTDEEGNTVCWGTTGSSGFKGSRKSTPFAATTTIKRAIDKAKDLGLIQAQCFIRGPGNGRDAALRVLRASRIKISMIADVTPIPHNGCRPKKRRRV